MTTININELDKYLEMYIKAKQPVFIHGKAGIGKSVGVRETVKRIAQQKGLKYVENNPKDNTEYGLQDIRASNYGPEDIKGLPSLNGDDWVKWLKPEFWPKEGTSGVIFFDELNLAPQSVQAACYQLILDRRIGNNVLPEGWTIIAAGNTDKDGAAVHRMAAPLKNRFAHFELSQPSVEIFADYMFKNQFNPNIINYLLFRDSPTTIHGYDSKLKGSAFPTPRSWEFASNMTKNIDNDEIEEKIIGSFVGEGLATEYIAHKQLKKKIDVKDLLKNPKKIKQIKDRALIFSIVGSLSEMYGRNNKEFDNIMEIAANLEPDMIVVLARMMHSKNKEKFINDIMTSKIYDQKVEKYVSKYL